MAATSHTAGKHLAGKADLAVLIRQRPADQVIGRQLDGLLGRHADQLRQHTRVQTTEALVAHHLLEAVDRVLVQPLPGQGAALVLQPSLDQVDRVHHEGAKRTRHAAQAEVVHGLERAAEEVAGGLLGCGGGGRLVVVVVHGVAPRGVEHLGEVAEAQAAGGLVEAGKVEEDVGLHRGEEGEAGDAGGLVEKLGAGDLAVGRLGGGAAQNDLDEVHLLDHVLEGADVGVGDLGALGDVAQRVQVVEQVVRQLVLGSLDNDARKVLGLDVPVAVAVEELEGLADALALEAAQHLRELGVVEVAALLAAADVQLGPLAVPVEGDVVGALVQLVQLAEVVVLDVAGAVHVEEAEGNLVLGVGLHEQVLEHAPVGEGDAPAVHAVGDAEQDRVLFARDLVLSPKVRVSDSLSSNRARLRPRSIPVSALGICCC